VHPFALAACADEARAAQVGEVARDLGLALAEHIDEITDADFAAIDEIEQAEARGIAERGEDLGEGSEMGSTGHDSIIYALTDISGANIFA